MRAAAGGFLAWTAGALTASAVGVLALSQLGDAVADRSLPPSLTVEQATGESPSPQPLVIDATQPPVVTSPAHSPHADRSPSPDSTGDDERILSTPAGTVVADCTADGAYLESWSPAQGFRADDVLRGPGVQVRVVFERGEYREVVIIRCIEGTAQANFHWSDD